MIARHSLVVTNSSPYIVGYVALLFAVILGVIGSAIGWMPTIVVSPETYLKVVAVAASETATQNGLDTSRHHTLFLIQSFLFQCLALEFSLLVIGFLILPKSIVVNEAFLQQTRVLAFVGIAAIFVIALVPFYVCEGIGWRCTWSYRSLLALAGFGSIALVLLPSVFLFFYAFQLRS